MIRRLIPVQCWKLFLKTLKNGCCSCGRMIWSGATDLGRSYILVGHSWMMSMQWVVAIPILSYPICWNCLLSYRARSSTDRVPLRSDPDLLHIQCTYEAVGKLCLACSDWLIDGWRNWFLLGLLLLLLCRCRYSQEAAWAAAVLNQIIPVA